MANVPRVVVGGLLVGAGAAVLAGPAPTSKHEKPLPPADSVKDLEKWLNDLAFLRDGRGLPVSTWLTATDDLLQMCAAMDREFLSFLTRTAYEAFSSPLTLSGTEVAEIVNEAIANAPFGVVQDPGGGFQMYGETGVEINLSNFPTDWINIFESSQPPEAPLATRRIFEVYNLVWEKFSLQNLSTAELLEDLYNETVSSYRNFLYAMGYLEAIRQTLSNQSDGDLLSDSVEIQWLDFAPQVVPLKALVGSVPQPPLLDLIPPHQSFTVDMSDFTEFSVTGSWSFTSVDVPKRSVRLQNEYNGLAGFLVREMSAALDDVRLKLDYTSGVGLAIAVLKTIQEEFHDGLRQTENVLRQAAEDLGYGVLATAVANTSTFLGLGLMGGGGYLISTAFTQGKAT